MINKFRKIYCGILQGFIAGAVAVLIVVNAWQVITRYLVAKTVLWTEDFSVLTMLWMGAAAFGWLWASHRMLSMDLASMFLPERVLRVFDWILEILGLVIGPGMAFVGAHAYITNSGFVVSMIGFDEKIRYMPLIAAGILITISTVLRICELKGIGGKETKV